MLEVELKFPCPKLEPVRAALLRLGARPSGSKAESDLYFNAPDRDFSRTDEALRLRRRGRENFLTYKGPKIDRSTKTRVEVEVPLANGPAAARDAVSLLAYLGYRRVSWVRKRRRSLSLRRNGFPVEACLDEVDSVGRFVELEVRAPSKMLGRARKALFELAAELGLCGAERRSYLELLLLKNGARRHG